ncbi:MAG: hypothetical protein ABL929_01910 [Ferruginibacter sp.]
MKKDDFFTEFNRMLQKQNFKSESEVQDFIKNYKQNIDSNTLPQYELTIEEQAQDMVFAASELPPKKAQEKIKEALLLNPDCIEAHEFLGLKEKDIRKAVFHFEDGINIGRRIFFGEKYNKYKGHFWGIHETRPFMRCLQHYAGCLFGLLKTNECVAIYEEMLALNPNDNQGVRDLFFVRILELNDFEKYKKYEKIYNTDVTAFAFYNSALAAFLTLGDTKTAQNKLAKAIKANVFVPKKLLSSKAITNVPSMYGFGDENEATYYAYFAKGLWQKNKAALNWLRLSTNTV